MFKKAIKRHNTENKIYIYGKHALIEALSHAPKAVKKVFLAPNADDAKLKELIVKTKVPVAEFSSGGAVSVNSSAAHQGVIGLVSVGNLMRTYKEFISGLSAGPGTSLVLLDELQDPQNVGAVIRSAAAFGISGVLIPEHNQAPITGAVVKVSAGMAFRIPLVLIGNVNSVIRDLKERGFWIYGLEGSAKKSITDESFDAPALFILGNESKGIRLKTRELCDALVSIPTDSRCESLNVAASAAVALYAWRVKHDIIKL